MGKIQTQATQEQITPQEPRFRVPFGEGIRRRRHALDITMADLGKMVGAAESTISRLEQRAGPPTSHVLIKKIAPILRARVDDLLSGAIPADLLRYSDPVAQGVDQGRPGSAQPYAPPAFGSVAPTLPQPGQVLVPHAGDGEDTEGMAEGLVAHLMADAIALEALSPADLRALVRLARSAREAAQFRAGTAGGDDTATVSPRLPRKEQMRVRHPKAHYATTEQRDE